MAGRKSCFQDESGVAIRGLFGVVRSISKITQNTEQKVHIACVFLSDDPDSIPVDTDNFSRLREQGLMSLRFPPRMAMAERLRADRTVPDSDPRQKWEST